MTDLAAFRIVQEALTNSIRHAGPATAAVAIRYGDADLRIEITDTGRGAPARSGNPASSHGSGHGLRGMRERAAAAGGTIDIGPGPSGGFRVVAEFPLDSPSAPAADATRTAPAGEATPATSADSTTQKAAR